MFGHRADGKKVKNLEPIFRILPSVMIDRSDAQVYFKQDIPLSNMDEYIDKKAQDGIRMSYMNIIYAGIATIVGSVLGMCVGFVILPEIIWMMYGMMYQILILQVFLALISYKRLFLVNVQGYVMAHIL